MRGNRRRDIQIAPQARTAAAAMVAFALVAVSFIAAPSRAGAATTAKSLTFTTTPAGATGGTAFATQPVVTFSGDTTTTDVVGLSLKTVSGGAGAVLTCSPVAASGGVASFGGCRIDRTGTYQLVATADGLTATSKSFTVAVGPASQVVFTTQPTAITAGTAFASAPALAVVDAGGNVVTGYTGDIGLAVVGVDAPGANALSCTDPSETGSPATSTPAYKVTAVNGQASFPSCTIDEASSSAYTLLAVAGGTSSNLANGTVLTSQSTAFSVSPGPASKLAFSTQPTGAQAGSAFTTQPVVTVEDAVGNTVMSATTQVTLTLGTSTTGSNLTCAPIAAVAGIATFAGCAIDRSGAADTLVASGGGFTATSSAFAVTAGSAAHLSFTTQPPSTGSTGGVPFATAPAVAVTDAGGTPVSASVTLSLTGGPTGAVLTCPHNPAAAGTGTATFAGCSVNRAGTYQLTATDPANPALSATSASFTVGVGPAAQLVFTAAPASATGGTGFTPQPTVAVEDLGGNPVPESADNVALSLTAGTGAAGARLSCSADPNNTVSTSTGSASFAGCAIDRAAAGYQLTASADGLVTTTSPFTVGAGAAAALRFTVQPSSGTVSSPLGGQPQVSVVDAGGNPVPSATPVTISASGPGALTCAADPVTSVAASGLAVFSGCQLASPGSYTLTASAAGLSPSTSTAITVVGGAPLGTAPVSPPTAQTFGGSDYSRNTTSTVDDVDTATGALELSLDDLKVAGIGEALDLVRSYNSADATGGVFGPGWSSILDAGVTVSADGRSAVVRGEDGQQLVFASNGAGGWVAPPGARATLTCSANATTCAVTRYDGVTWHSQSGHIQDYLAPSGQGLHFTYSGGHLTTISVAGSTKPLTIRVGESSSGQVTSLTTPTRTVSYSYLSPTGPVTGYTDADGNGWGYVYGAACSIPAGCLTQENDPTGALRLQVTYAASGRVAGATLRGSAKHFADTYAWNASTGTSTRTANVDAGAQRLTGTYIDTYKGNVLVSQQQASGATTAYSYDGQLDPTAMQDPLGRVTTMAYNSSGDLTSQTTPYTATASSTTRYGYDTAHHITSVTDGDGNTTTFTYSGANLVTATPPGPASGATHYLYNSLGEQTEADGPTGITTFTYDAAGNQAGYQKLDLHRTSLDGAGPSVTYDEAGDKLVSTDARGTGTKNPVAYQTTDTYDPDGHLLTATSPGAQTTTTTYTAAGDVASTTPPGGSTTTYSWNEATLTDTATTGTSTSVSTYDPSGDLLSRTQGGATTSHLYDSSGRQVSTTDTANITTTDTYNLIGDVVATADSAGHTGAYTYDPQNRVVASVINGVSSSSAYDAAGNLVSQTDAAGRTTTYTFNSHEKLASVHTAAGTTTYGYDPSDEVVTTTDGNGHATTTSWNAAGEKVGSTVAGHTTTYAYDNAGNLVGVVDPDGRRTAYTLNAEDQRTDTSYSQSGQPTIDVTQTYNAAGQRTQMSDPTTGTTTFGYDTSGNLTSAKNAYTGNYSYDYSTPGQMTETYPDGTKVITAYDDAHNVMDVSSGSVNVSYLRNTARQVTGMAYANGIVETDGVNTAGQVTSQTLSCGGTTEATTAYGYDAAGDPLGSQTTVGGTTTTDAYGYDGNGRLSAQSTASTSATQSTSTGSCTTGTEASAGSPAGSDSSGQTSDSSAPTSANQPTAAPGLSGATATGANPVTYDAVGNQVSNQTPSGTTTATYNTADENTAWSYDGAGDVTKAGNTTYGYDAADRLVRVSSPTSTTTYTYDGDGNRVSQTVTPLGGTPTTTYYSWDRSGNVPLLALETTGHGGSGLIRRYLYGVGPVALQTPQGTWYYHTDASGDVTALSDSTGAIVETYSYDAYGNVTPTKVGTAAAPTNPLLFQGQYLDSSTGLYDMRARNYDPGTGRFTQRDPVTPQVGTPVTSPYVFAGDQPTTSGDPTGELPSQVTKALEGHSTESASDVADAGYGLKAAKFLLVKPAIAIAKYAGAFEEAGLAAGKAAFANGANIADALEEGARVAGGGELSDVAGKALGVVGIGLGLYTTIEDCENGPVQQCVGDTVGLAFSVGCLAISDGLGSVACGLLGAGLSYVISNYGPQIAQGLVDFGGLVAEGATIAAGAIARGFAQAGTAITGAFADAGQSITLGLVTAGNAIGGALLTGAGALATGFNEAGTAIASGYRAAVATLEQAGYTAVQMANVLAGVFALGVNAVVNQLANLSYDVDAVASALENTFHEAAEAAAAVLQTFQYGVDEVATALKNTFQLADQAAAQILGDLSYVVTDIAGALRTVFSDADQAVAQVLQNLSYSVNQITSALSSAFSDVDQTIAGVLRDLTSPYTLTQIAGALDTVLGDADTAVAQVFANLQIGATDIATALDGAFQDSDQAVAQILQNLSYSLDNVATALEDAYGEAADTVAGVLKNIGDSAKQIAGVLSDVFDESTSEIENVLKNVLGFADSAIQAIGGAFQSFGQDLEDAGKTIAGWFGK